MKQRDDWIYSESIVCEQVALVFKKSAKLDAIGCNGCMQVHLNVHVCL